MAIIVPAILEKTKEAFEKKANLLMRIAGVERIHVDFSDGEFVPSKTVQAGELDVLNPAFEWEAHLMIKNPDDFLEYQIAGFKHILVHLEAFENTQDLLETIQAIKQVGARPGIAINPTTALSGLEHLKNFVDYYMIMSVNPGFQGSEFVTNSPQRIKELKNLIPHAIIEVDGSVNESTIQLLMTAKPDLLVAGSAIVKAENPFESFERLTQMAII